MKEEQSKQVITFNQEHEIKLESVYQEKLNQLEEIYSKKLDEKESKVKDLNVELEEIRIQCESSESQNRLQVHLINTLEEEKESVMMKLKEIEENLQNMKEQNEKLEFTLSEKSGFISQLECDINRLNEKLLEVPILQQRVEELTRELNCALNQSQERNASESQLLTQIADLQTQIYESKQEKEVETNQLRQQLKDFELEMKKLVSSLNAKSETIESLLNEKLELEKEQDQYVIIF